MIALERKARWSEFLAVPVPGLRLGAYYVRATRMSENGRTWWTECEMDFDEPLGRERAIQQWATRECGAAKDTALRFVRVVGAIADAAGGVRHIGDFDRVPAVLHKEWREFGRRIAVVAGASWCRWCAHSPASSPGGECVWCCREDAT